MKRERASQASPAEIRVMALDEDDNLLRAALYIIDNSSHEIVWSEMKALEGAGQILSSPGRRLYARSPWMAHITGRCLPPMS